MAQSKIKIAIVDDHKMMRAALAKLLQSINNQFDIILQAENGRDLIRQLETLNTMPGIILLDISMPVMNGYETLKAIRKKWPKQKVLALSTYNDDYVILKMILHGANGYICKTQSPEELAHAILNVHKGIKYYTEETEHFFSEKMVMLKQLIPTISPKELQFLSYCGQDLKYDEIAKAMEVSVRTIDSYRDNLFKKLNLRSRLGLAFFAWHTGLVPGGESCP